MRQCCRIALIGSILVGIILPNLAKGDAVGPAAVAAALDRLDRWLATGPHGAAWSEYLRVDALRKQLARSGQPDLRVLETSLKRLAADQPGLDLPPLLAVRTSLEGWLARAALPAGAGLKTVTDSIEQRFAADDAKMQRPPLLLVADGEPSDAPLRYRQQFTTRLNTLRAMLAAHADDPSPWLADEIGATLDWLSNTGRAEPLVAAVRDYYGQPNVLIDVSENSLAGGVDGAIERPITVEDSILGTTVRGRGVTKAQTKLLFEPHDERAVMILRVKGTIDTTTVGRNGPARIYSQALTTFQAEKKFWLNENGLKALPTACTAETATLSADVHAASRGVRGRIVKRAAQRQVRQQQEEADRIAARHAEDEIRDLVDHEASVLVSQVERCAITPLLALAKDSGDSVRFRFRTAPGLLRIGVILGPLGAPPGGSCNPIKSGLAIRLHSTVVDRLMQHPWAETVLASLQFDNPFTAGINAVLPSSFVKKADSWSQQFARLTGVAPVESTPSGTAVISGARLENAAEQFLNQVLAPGISADGITLRGGRLGTIAPGGPGSPWMSLAWGSPAPPARLAQQPRGSVE